MAKISGLVKAIADATGCPHSVVKLYARRLTDAGLLPKSSGRRYAQASPEHAAVLIIAMLSTDQPADAPRNVQKYGSTTYNSRQFLAFMVNLIDGASRLDREIWWLLSHSTFCFERKPIEWIHYRVNDFRRHQTLPDSWFVAEPSVHKKLREKNQRIKVEASLSGSILCGIGAFFANVPYHKANMELMTEYPGSVKIDHKAALDKL